MPRNTDFLGSNPVLQKFGARTHDSNSDINQRNKPWTSSSSLSLGYGELCCSVNPASCTLTGNPSGRQAGQTLPPPTVTTKGTCCVKGFAPASQPSKCLASCCRLLMGPKLVTREISSIQSFPNLCWWNLSNPIAFYDSKWSFSTASLLS